MILKLWTSMILAVLVVLAIAISLGTYLFIQQFFHGYRIEIVSVMDKPAILAEVLGNLKVGEKDFFVYALESSLGRTDADSTARLKELENFLGKYGLNYEIRLESSARTAFCSNSGKYSNAHKAIDIVAACGTPVRAICDGNARKSTGQAGILKDALILDETENCNAPADLSAELEKNRFWYACVKQYGKGGDVKSGDIIGTVDACNENGLDCHLHLSRQIKKEGFAGGVEDADPSFICNYLDSVIDAGRIIAGKGTVDNERVFTLPMVYRDKIINMVIKVEG